MKFHTSKIKTVGLLFIWFIVITIGIEILIDSQKIFHNSNQYLANLTGCFLVLVSGFLCFSTAMQFVRKMPIIVFDSEGILDARNGIGVIAWNDIDSLSLFSVYGSTGINVNLKEPDMYLNRLNGWKRVSTKNGISFGLPFTVIPFLGLTPSIDSAKEYIRSRQPGVIRE